MREMQEADFNFNPRSPHGERRGKARRDHRGGNFNPRSPHGERRRLHHGRRWHDHISIHAPRTGSDTGGDPFFYDSWDISIHAPRTGSDDLYPRRRHDRRYFNPRSPHGERCLLLSGYAAPAFDFNPRSPHGERLRQAPVPPCVRDFNPRSPHGERPAVRPVRCRA